MWIHSVPSSVLEATLPDEVKRQECIYELIYTERDFVKDLKYMDEVIYYLETKSPYNL